MLKARIIDDLKTAMRARDEIARDTLRMLKSEVTLREVDKGSELDDGEVQQVLRKALKSREESAAQYAAAGRTDLTAKERAEMEVIRRYLPQELDEAALRSALASLAKELGIESKRDMGRLMKSLMERHPGQVDGKKAASIASELLG